MTASADDSHEAWEQWLDAQISLCGDLDERIGKAVSERSDAFGAALVAALIEHLGEKLRQFINLPASDVRAEEGT